MRALPRACGAAGGSRQTFSLETRPRDEKELVGLVYSLTKKPSEGHIEWYKRPATLGIVVIVGLVLVLMWNVYEHREGARLHEEPAIVTLHSLAAWAIG